VTRCGYKYKQLRHPSWASLFALPLFFSSVCMIYAMDDENSESKPGFKSIVIATDGLECPIRLHDPYGGMLNKFGYDLNGTAPPLKKNLNIHLSLQCRKAADAEKSGFDVFRFDTQTSTWVKDISSLSEEGKELLGPYIKLFPLKAHNSEGIGVTEVLTPGSDWGYPVLFTFCLRRSPIVLCGSMNGVAGVEPRDSTRYVYNDLPDILRLIESIEFIDLPASARSNSTSAQPSSSVSTKL
jgi:hypothetical protein